MGEVEEKVVVKGKKKFSGKVLPCDDEVQGMNIPRVGRSGEVEAQGQSRNDDERVWMGH